MARKSHEVVHRKLQDAAFELFHERGFDQATAAEIAARADVTERTFFRHFADKRDIVFECQDGTNAIMSDHVARAPAHLGPINALRFAFHAAAAHFEEMRLFIKPRLKVISCSPALRERQASRTASLVAALTVALERRGVAPRAAGMAAQLGVTAFSYAWESWLEEDSESWDDARIEHAFGELGVLLADHALAGHAGCRG